MTRSIAALLLMFCTGLMLQACSDEDGSPEAEIRAYVERGTGLAESRSADGLSELVHDGYLDQKGYNKKQLTGLLRAYFFRHKNIHLFTRIGEIDLPSENRATVKFYVAMAGSEISGIDALSRLRAQIYEFELQLIRQDEWLLQHASWAPASIVDLK